MAQVHAHDRYAALRNSLRYQEVCRGFRVCIHTYWSPLTIVTAVVEALCSVAQLIEGSGDYVECQMSDPEGLEGLWHSEVGAMANIVGWQMNALVRTRLAAHGAPAFMPDFNVPLWPHFWRFVHDELQQAAKFHSVYVHRFKLMLKAMPIFEHDCLFEFTRRQWPYQWY